MTCVPAEPWCQCWGLTRHACSQNAIFYLYSEWKKNGDYDKSELAPAFKKFVKESKELNVRPSHSVVLCLACAHCAYTSSSECCQNAHLPASSNTYLMNRCNTAEVWTDNADVLCCGSGHLQGAQAVPGHQLQAPRGIEAGCRLCILCEQTHHAHSAVDSVQRPNSCVRHHFWPWHKNVRVRGCSIVIKSWRLRS